MNQFFKYKLNLEELDNFAKKLAQKTITGDIFLLKGELGTGKTTFARFLINSLHKKYKIKEPEFIKSPSYPILINYPVENFEIDHYDLYRLKNRNELQELGFFQEINKNISIVEWPEILLKNFKINKYCLIEFKFDNLDKRSIQIAYYK